MTFAPAIPLSGIAGWTLLKRVEADQRALFAKSPQIVREATYFAENIAQARTAGDLVGDRRLLSVVLSAFGLETEVDKRAFVRAALESDPLDRESFANRLVDKRYRDLAKAFGYGSAGGPRVDRPGFGPSIVSAFKARSFEKALGENDPSLRLALNARRELMNYASSGDPERTAWFSAMGDRPVRAVLEDAFGMPASFSQLDLERQVEEFRGKARSLFGSGSMAVFSDPENVETVIRRFLARESASQGPSLGTPGMTALSLLQQGGAGLNNLVQSRFS